MWDKKLQTQEEWVIDQLKTTGKISRNDCLKTYISRLGAIICHLKKIGYVFETNYVTTPFGQDFVYSVKGMPIEGEKNEENN